MKYKRYNRTMFSFTVKSNIMEFEQTIHIVRYHNILFNNKQFITMNNITLSIEQFLEEIHNGNYYVNEILIKMKKIVFDDESINKLVSAIIKVSACIINNSKLCKNMIYYINQPENNFIRYTLWKLSYIVGSTHNPINIKNISIDYENKERMDIDILKVKNQIIYTYDKYKKNLEYNDEYNFLKDSLLNYINLNYVF